MAGTEELDRMEMGFKETVGRQGRLEKLESRLLLVMIPRHRLLAGEGGFSFSSIFELSDSGADV